MTMPPAPPRLMLGRCTGPLGVLVEGIMRGLAPCSTLAGMSWAPWLVEGLTWKNKDKE